MIQFVKYHKSYGSNTVLKIDNLAVQPGIYWIKGANGSGKSTFLKTIAGIIHFDGDILLNQHISVKKKPVAFRKLVNFAEAEPIFPTFLTGREMVKLFTSTKGAPGGQEAYFIDSMQMNDYINEPIGTYSSGMLKKLSIVLAFIGNPQLILLDEPLITIDTESLKILYKWIEEKNQKEHVSFFLSSHQPLDINELTLTDALLVDMQTVKFKP
ncbi:MAG: ABC transporter ATP-binding protein [Bacteroidota bacterium]